MDIKWLKFAKIAKTVGKGAKWTFEHSDEIEHASNLATKIHNKFTAKKYTETNNAEPSSDTMQNDALESYAEKLELLEAQCELLNDDLSNLREELALGLKQYSNEIDAIKQAFTLYETKTRRNFVLLSIFSGIGIFLAVILAIVI